MVANIARTVSTFCSQMANSSPTSLASLMARRSAPENSLGLSKLASSPPDAERTTHGPIAGAAYHRASCGHPSVHDRTTQGQRDCQRWQALAWWHRFRQPLMRKLMRLSRGRGPGFAAARALTYNSNVARRTLTRTLAV